MNTVTNNEHKAIGRIFDTLSSRVSSQGFSFGESLTNVNKDWKNDLVNTTVNVAFGSDLNKAKGESNVATNAGINARLRSSFIKTLQEEMKARGEMLLSPEGESFSLIASQQYQVYGSHSLNANQQLLLMALCPAVIKPIHNKIIKSIVTKDIEFSRTGFLPVIFDEFGNTYNFFDVVNDPETMRKIRTGGQPLMSVVVEMENGAIKDKKFSNLCEIYNRVEQAKDPINFKAIKSIHDFVATGVRITHVLYDNTKIAVSYQGVKARTQSGQLSKMVAPITLRLNNEQDPDKAPIDIVGRVDADGTVILTCSSSDDNAEANKVKGVVFEFIVPAKGPESPVKIMDMETAFTTPIQDKATAVTTLNNQLIDDVQLVLNKDIVARFTETAVEFVNANKDNKVLDYINNHLIDMANNASNLSSLVNDETLQSLKAVYSYDQVDMNVAKAGYTDILTAHNVILSRSLFNVMNRIDKKLNPAERNFSIFSDSAASQWVRDINGNDVNKFNIVGSATTEDGSIAGFATPYELQNVKVGNLYTGTYIVSNKIDGTDVTKSVVNGGGKVENAVARKHRYYILPKFEEKMDTILFLNGLERIVEGVNDTEYKYDKTLYYDTRFDIAIYNKSIGAVDFIESPVASLSK